MEYACKRYKRHTHTHMSGNLLLYASLGVLAITQWGGRKLNGTRCVCDHNTVLVVQRTDVGAYAQTRNEAAWWVDALVAAAIAMLVMVLLYEAYAFMRRTILTRS